MSILSTFTLLFDTDAKEASKDVDDFTDSTSKSEDASKKSAEQSRKEKGEREGLRKETDSLVRSVGELIGSYIGLRTIISGVLSSAASANQLDNLSSAFGLNASEMDRWGKVAKRAGGSASAFQNSMTGLQKNLTQIDMPDGNSSFLEAMSKAGVIGNYRNPDGSIKDAFEFLPALIERFSELENAEAMNFGVALGIDEQSMAVLLKGADELARHGKEADKSYSASDSDRKAYQDFSEKMVDVSESFDGVMTRLGGQVLPTVSLVLGEIADILNGLAMTTSDNEFLGVIAAVISGLALLGGRVLGLGKPFSGIGRSILSFIRVLRLPLAAALYFIMEIFEDLYAFFAGRESVFGAFLQGTSNLWDLHSKRIGKKFKEWIDEIIDYFEELSDGITGWMKTIVNNISNYFLDLSSRGINTMSEFIEDIKSIFARLKDWFLDLDLFGFVERGLDSIKGFVGWGSKPNTETFDFDDTDPTIETHEFDDTDPTIETHDFDGAAQNFKRHGFLEGELDSSVNNSSLPWESGSTGINDISSLNQIIEQGDQALLYSGGINTTAEVAQRAVSQVSNQYVSMSNTFEVVINADGMSSESAASMIPQSLADEFEAAIATMSDGITA
ncbi:hypothetical protein VCHA50P417_20493 [Vibrio chagasii]|nr:hypothetical protein VCHA50P417_20493 [Vibrio chagasii]